MPISASIWAANSCVARGMESGLSSAGAYHFPAAKTWSRLKKGGQFFLPRSGQTNDLHGCMVAVLEPDAQGARLERDDVVRLLSARVHSLPSRLKQVLKPTAFGLGAPLLVDDPKFAPAEQVRVTPEEMTWSEFDLAVGRYVQEHLDMTKPLFEIMVYSGLPEGHSALVLKVHHTIFEAQVAMNTIGAALFGVTPTENTGAPQVFNAAPAPNGVEQVQAALMGGIADVGDAASAVARYVFGWRHPRKHMQRHMEIWDAYRAQIATKRAASSFDRAEASPLAFPVATCDADTVRAIRKSAGFPTSFSDVTMAAIAGAMREMLLAEGRAPERFTIQIPVPLDDSKTAFVRDFDDLPPFMVIDLPLDEADPVTRLRRIAEMCAERRAMAGAINDLIRPMEHLPRGLYQGACGYVHNRAANAYMTNVRGPDFPIYLLTHKVSKIYGIAPIRGDRSLRFIVVGHSGKVNITCGCDTGVVRNPRGFADAVEASLAELREGVIGDAGPDIEQPELERPDTERPDMEQPAAKQPALTS